MTKINNLYVGYITKNGKSSWVNDGVFKGFINNDEVINYIDALIGKNIERISIFSEKRFKQEMLKIN